jgi:hypothetical protein
VAAEEVVVVAVAVAVAEVAEEAAGPALSCPWAVAPAVAAADVFAGAQSPAALPPPFHPVGSGE